MYFNMWSNTVSMPMRMDSLIFSLMYSKYDQMIVLILRHWRWFEIWIIFLILLLCYARCFRFINKLFGVGFILLLCWKCVRYVWLIYRFRFIRKWVEWIIFYGSQDSGINGGWSLFITSVIMIMCHWNLVKEECLHNINTLFILILVILNYLDYHVLIITYLLYFSFLSQILLIYQDPFNWLFLDQLYQ